MPFVLDNSVVTGWYIGDQASDYADAIAARLETDRAIVPAVWQLEFTNILRTACMKGKMSVDAARQIVDVVTSLPIDVDHVTPGPRQLLELAIRCNLSSYDAAYLELALRHALPLASRDNELRNAALGEGVGLL
jgi:predicted nucleic acid-binding protein